MREILKMYLGQNLVPFSLTVGWNTTKNKKKFILPVGWVDVNKTNYKQYINSNILSKKGDENLINKTNILAVKMGSISNDNMRIIGVDIDDKKDSNDILNGLTKWKEILLKNKMNNFVAFDTFIQQTGNKGLHYLFKVSEEQYSLIKNITNLEIDGKNYSIDIKADENSFLVVEPSSYFDNNNKSYYYTWLKNKNICNIPDWLFNLIKIKNVENIKSVIKNEIDESIKKSIETNVEITNRDKTKSLFFKLDKKRLNTYPLWYKLACLIKSVYKKNEGLKLLIELSKNSEHYENDEWIIEKYNNEIIQKSYTLNTLYYWLKRDNPKEYQNYLIDRKQEEKIVDIIEIEDEYLLDIKDKQLNNDTILNNNFNEFMTNDNIKSFNIKSTYNTGKTQFIKTVIKKYNPKKILWITYRQSLTNDIKGNFKNLQFQSYMDGKYDANRQIIQLESLMKLGNSDAFINDEVDIDIDIPTYDLVILDEIEGILCHASNSVTFKGQNKEVFEFLEKIIECSNKLITLDGDMSNRTYNFINSFGPSINIVNKIKKNKKTFKFVDSEYNFKESIFKQLNENKKIVIVSQSKQKAEVLKEEIQQKYTKLKVLIYTSITGDKEKMKLEDVNNIWSKCDVLIYSPTIEAGVNFDILHFDKIFGIISRNTSSQRAFMQMLSRVRKTTDNEIIILNTDFELYDVKEYFSYYDAYEASKEMKQFKLNRVYDLNKKCYRLTYNNYLTNYLYNIVEEQNKEPYYFLSKLKNIMESKGHEVIFEYSEKETNNDETNIEIELDDKEKNEFFIKIVNAKLINNDAYKFYLQLKKANKATEDEKILLIKKYYSDIFGTENLSYDDLQIWYYNLYKIKNYSNLLDTNNYKINNEIKNEVAYEKLLLTKDILNNLGLSIKNNTIYITNDELNKKFSDIYKTNKIYTCPKSSKLFFKSNIFKLNEKTTTKAILGHINTLLENYLIKISQKRLRINGNRENVYFIETLNDVDNIIKRRTNTNNNDEIEI